MFLIEWSQVWKGGCCAVLSCTVMSDSLQPHGLWPARLLCPWDSPGKNTGVGCHVFFQGIFPTQGLNPDLLHCRQILYHLSHQRTQGILEWVAYLFSRGSYQPRNQTRVSYIAGGFFTSWTTTEAPEGWLGQSVQFYLAHTLWYHH